MKITLDLSKLLEQGKITPADADKLRALAADETGSLGVNILIGFGVIAVAAGAVALVPTPATGFAIGLGLFAAGLGLIFTRAQAWEVLAQICIVIGALMFAGGVIALGKGSLASLLIVTAILAAASIVARPSLLIAFAVLALAACLGAQTGYSHASYSLAIYEPTVTIVLFSLLALGAYHVSKQLKADYERIALTAARTSVFLVNFGFWIGSLWGDPLRLLRRLAISDPTKATDFIFHGEKIPASVFSIGWALALIAVGIWGVKANRRWVVNIAAVFGAIHFYTQWFGKLGANAASVLMGGILMLAFALGLYGFNKRVQA